MANVEPKCPNPVCGTRTGAKNFMVQNNVLKFPNGVLAAGFWCAECGVVLGMSAMSAPNASSLVRPATSDIKQLVS